jgi:hypothetical protein
VIDLFIHIFIASIMKRYTFVKKLCKHFSLRLHMTLILLATALVGIISSKVLLISGFQNPALRFPLAIIVSYMFFYIAIRIWLWIVIGSTAVNSKNHDRSIPDFPDISLPDDSSSKADDTVFSGGGGCYSGGGASGAFEAPVSSAGSSGASSSGGFPGSFDVDESIGIIIVFALLALLLFAIFGSSAYMIYQAPSMLSEIAFDSALAVSLIRKSKKMQDPDWIGSVFKATWKQFAGILLVSIITGIAIHAIFPEVTKVSELFIIVF